MTLRSKSFVSEDQGKSWGRLVVSIRQTALALSDYLALPELARLLQTILLGTIVTFIAVVNGFGDALFPTRLVCFLVVACLSSKLFCKAYMAERITAAVSWQYLTIVGTRRK